MKYEVISPLKDDAGLHGIGDTVEMAEKDARELIDIGVLAAVAAAAPVDDQERQAAIAAAIGQIDAANADLWLKDGKPSTDAIAAITGGPVSAAERDAAWASLPA